MVHTGASPDGPFEEPASFLTWPEGNGRLVRHLVKAAGGRIVTGAVVFDVVLTGLPIVTYGPEHLSGLMVGPMPIEDLGYGIALFLLAVLPWDAVAPRPRR